MNGFWIYFIVAWMLVHRGTQGKYKLKGKPAAMEGALVFLVVSICFAFIGMLAPVPEFLRLLSVGMLWFSILRLRNARPGAESAESIEQAWQRMQEEREQKVRQLEQKEKRPAAQAPGRRDLHEARGDLEQHKRENIPHRHTGGHDIDTGNLQPGTYRQYRTTEESRKAGAHHDELSPATPAQYYSQQAEVQDLVREVLELAPDSAADAQSRLEAGLQAEQARYEAELAAETARHESELSEVRAATEDELAAARAHLVEALEAGPQDEPAASPEPAAASADTSHNWQPPVFASRVEQVASSTPQQRPDSLFSRRGPSSLGTGVQSMFDGPSQRREPEPVAGAAEAAALPDGTALLKDEELSRPDAPADSAPTARRFQYQPPEGLKSRF